MTIDISSNNEHRFYPDIQDNRERPEKDRFCVVLRRVSKYKMSRVAWKFNTKENAGAEYSPDDFIRESIVRLENAPILKDEKGVERETEVEDFFVVPELAAIAITIETHAWKLYNEGALEVKN